VLQFARDPPVTSKKVKLKLKNAYFCRVRFCPVCQWRRSLRWQAKVYQALPQLRRDYPDTKGENQNVGMGMVEQLPDWQVKMLVDGTGYLSLHVCVKYRDVLTTEERITEFAGFYPGLPGELGSIAVDLRY
jgi:hypothetical protein